MMAGASLVGIGTAAMRDPRTPTRIVKDLDAWCASHGVNSINEVVGTLDWKTA
jgi:dihydroorotate dehydrogenase (NAD+) catalytic subunit